jgi:hypothetical protein
MNISDICLENMVLKTAKGADLPFSINGDKYSVSGLQPPMGQRRSATRLSNMEPSIRPWK